MTVSHFSALAFAGFLLASHGFAADVVPSPKRQVVNCMIKQMAVSKTISYNDASKLCKDQVRAQTETLADTTKPVSVREYRSPPQSP